MMRTHTIRLARSGSLATMMYVLACGTIHAQTSPANRRPSAALPATAPTAAFVATPSTPATSLTPAQRPARRAEVKFAEGQLAVTADNASLNQILREIGRATGIKITGGVAEERVFGKYGPATPEGVLNALLDGTGSNMLMIQPDSGAPGELVLTPRHGGPTPPNPSAPGFDDDAPSGDGTQTMQPSQIPLAPNQPQGVGSQVAPQTTGAPAGSAPATDASDPNAVKTPQQIYEQLQRLRQQQQPPPQ